MNKTSTTELPEIDFQSLVAFLEQLTIQQELFEQIEQLNRAILLLQQQRDQLTHQLEQDCSHPLGLEYREKYFSGTYTDRAHTEYWVQCPICGFKTEPRVDIHSYYG